MTQYPTEKPPESPLDFTALTVDAVTGNISAVEAKSGQSYALYYFTPLQDDIDNDDHGKKPQFMPKYAHEWPEYIRSFVSQYVPMPYTSDLTIPAGIRREDIRSQARTADPTRPWAQLSYKYWPLYYVLPGKSKKDAQDHPALFQGATSGMAELKPARDPELWPSNVLGP